ncbi:D-alanine--D-alanine ligase family protein, partial [Singulisphaera rosea]
EVALLGDGRAFLEQVLAAPPDFVWNLAEGEGIGRSREARVPAVLEMLGIPYSGSDPFTLAVSLDKDAAKRLVRGADVEIPRGLSIPSERSASDIPSILADSGLGGVATLILKPAFEGSSKGIRARCLAETPEEAVELFKTLAHDYRQPILIEEFIAGDEVTVGLTGNGDSLQVLGAMRIRPKVRDDRFIYSLEVKRDWDERVAYETPARLEDDVQRRLLHSARSAYVALGCRDVARIDYRIRAGIPYFIEANPLPGLAPDWSDLVILARGVGLGYPELIRRILDSALARVGLATAGPAGGPR